MWIQDSLPDDLRLWMNTSGLDKKWSIRVLSYGYDSRLDKSNSFQNVTDLANRFRHAIRAVRQVLPHPQHSPSLCSGQALNRV